MERTSPVEFRAAGRTLTGPVVTYGEVAQDRRERFGTGAFTSSENPLALRLQHDPAIVVATTDDRLTVADSAAALTATAELVPGAALSLVERRALRGLSVEFVPLAEHRDSEGVRVITEAHLAGIGLVDAGSYAGSAVELRARMGRTLTSTVPTGKRLACECCAPDARWAELQAEMADAINGAIRQAFEEAAEDGNDIIAAFGRYDRPLASAKTGTLRTAVVGDGVRVDIDLPDDDNGRAVVAAQEAAGVVVRPYIDEANVQREMLGDGAVRYSPKGDLPPIRALIVSATDRREGWPTPVIGPTPDLETRASGLAVPRRRRRHLALL